MRGIRNVAYLIVLATVIFQPAEAGKIYWTETYCTEVCDARILRANPDGSDVAAVTSTVPSGFEGIALDPLRGEVYWSQIGPDHGIRRGNEDDCGWLTHDVYQQKLQIDPTAGALYWQSHPYRIERIGLDGSAREIVYQSTDTWEITSFALDPDNAKRYVAESDYHNVGERLIEINADGSGFSLVFSPDVRIVDLSVDPTAGAIYWSSGWPYQIRRVGVDGSNDELLLELDSDGWTIAVDSLGGKIYWAQFGTGIQRADLDGTNAEVLVPDAHSRYLALDPQDEVGVAWIDCAIPPVPALGRRGALALAILLLAASGWWLSRRSARRA